jgi:hypothetical protein
MSKIVKLILFFFNSSTWNPTVGVTSNVEAYVRISRRVYGQLTDLLWFEVVDEGCLAGVI